MLKFFKVIVFFNLIFLLNACGGNSSSTRNDPTDFTIDGTFIGKDSANRDASVAVDSANDTIDIALSTATESFDLEGDIVLTSVASTGKKYATGDITYHVDLLITKSTLEGFEVGQTSFGTIIKKVDDVNGNQYTCAFNFTDNTTRATSEADSDWSMSGTISQ